ncbi:hypothetical protein T310_3115 [Rasamsonia emersonii CBS 393.64]|uniref:MARVEL domain-containing protein n=1 Tax=Rasamsonia emersonii (strain ATCC 16479 / CBS 393.64 / IMI 116815) TaxID=1408163 RepID=A0A0F4YX96_RASE3|nr:hypothetical protein T310_3115 [Rasamsonia emersonii CBS 393.64]KKA22859.1 hypothetical protein T310_3115 [Rasamsonia emersonii CBS 393.64]
MFESVLFIFWRLVEITFLIPIIGMLAYFVNGFLNSNQLTPAYILVLFIVSVIAVFWCLDTLIRFRTTKRSAAFVAFVDLCFFGALIAGVYELRFIAGADCTDWNGGSVRVSLGPFGSLDYQTDHFTVDINKTCAMLKASFAMGIMEVVFFFFTAFFAHLIFRNHQDDVTNGISSASEWTCNQKDDYSAT